MQRLLAAALLLVPLAARADCLDQFPGKRAPTASTAVTLLCSTSFATGYSAPTREPAWSVEHLTEEGVAAAERLQGRATFHEDLRIPANERSQLLDYRRSGWTRGHMAPSGDAPTHDARVETFALSNIVPQASKLNSGHWNQIEQNVRHLAEREGEIYVVTGPAFREPLGTIGPDHVRVPSSVWKAVYAPSLASVAVVVCKNSAPYSCNAVGLASLQRVTGVDPFPGVHSDERADKAGVGRMLLR
ncbi:DNA/RNA non-specific endonuclease [Acetobacter sacchari]|uniref:DNA/RNA non-specific endonuclease n=1 Tax=Acetobacter sacchari TaxID=2661687 RepID=A0ABS3M1B9_9PROT|nr:DNA/RNA non-specific endonuclease [Acetobacter sacchari]MBO1361938.1 DNA/RNA non-specific endonuclease [Acetobacter sacchari]